MQVLVRGWGKLNLSLRVLGVREDGYHLLDMITAPVGLGDEIVVRCGARLDDLGQNAACITHESDGLRVRLYSDKSYVDLRAIPPDNNTAVSAARLMRREFGLGELDVVIHKNIPLGAGLGGSSADAAGIIAAVAEAHCLDIMGNTIKQIALKCGADVYGMLMPGYKRVGGIGDSYKPLVCTQKLWAVITMDSHGVSSKLAYKTFDQLPKPTAPQPDTNDILEGLLLGKGKREDYKRVVHNDLLDASVQLNPNIAATLSALNAHGSGALAVAMTGSGSACFALFDSHALALKCHTSLSTNTQLPFTELTPLFLPTN